MQCAVPLVSACRSAAISSGNDPLSLSTNDSSRRLCASQLTAYCSAAILMYLTPSPTQRVDTAPTSSVSLSSVNSITCINSSSDLQTRTAAVLYHVEQMMFRIGRFA